MKSVEGARGYKCSFTILWLLGLRLSKCHEYRIRDNIAAEVKMWATEILRCCCSVTECLCSYHTRPCIWQIALLAINELPTSGKRHVDNSLSKKNSPESLFSLFLKAPERKENPSIYLAVFHLDLGLSVNSSTHEGKAIKSTDILTLRLVWCLPCTFILWDISVNGNRMDCQHVGTFNLGISYLF